LNDPESEVLDSAAGIPPDYYFQPLSNDPFPLWLESTQKLRDFAIENKEEIVAYAPFTESSTKWLNEFVEYMNQSNLKFESDITLLAQFAHDEAIFSNYSDEMLNAINKIYRIAEDDDRRQYKIYGDFIRQRLYQIAIEAQFGEERAYREAIVPYRRDIILAEEVLLHKTKN
ncbi:MAG: hypothetical protein AB1746_03765, partial [Candidatus Zixiibacteriota bacterium]